MQCAFAIAIVSVLPRYCRWYCMVLILDGNSEIGAQMGHLVRSTAVAILYISIYHDVVQTDKVDHTYRINAKKSLTVFFMSNKTNAVCKI